MIKRTFGLLGLLAVCLQSGAAILPPEKLLPKNTIVLVTVLDGAKTWSTFTNTAAGQLWADPSLKAFKVKFIGKLEKDLVGPAERELGIKMADFQGLIQGQVTFALLENETDADEPFSPLFLMDTKDRADQLKKTLADAKKKWVDAGKTVKTEEIRGIQFTTFVASSADFTNALKNVLPPKSPAIKAHADGEEEDAEEESADEAESKPEKFEVLMGQVDSLLIIGKSSKTIEKVLNRQSGGLIPALEEESAFQADYAARLRQAPAYAWVNVKSLLKAYQDQEEAPEAATKMMEAMGISDLKTVALTWKNVPEGIMTQFFVGAPEASRRGLFKLFGLKPTDSTPPPFVPADAVKFMRWRLDLQETWTSFETMLGDMNPAAKGMASFLFDSAGKQKDEKYDLKAELLGNLGNDIINYQKAPRGTSLADIASPPSLFLIGSPNPDRLAMAIKIILGAFIPNAAVKESDFLGRKMYSITLPQRGPTAPVTTSFSGNGTYLAISTDTVLLEEYLRSNESKAKALSETAGLNEAAQKVGGMNTGLFGFSDQRLEMKSALEALRKSSGNVTELFTGTAVPGDPLKWVKEWTDFSLLPPFESISKYFYYTVYAGSYSADGFTLNYFAPNPPQAKAKAE